jgi:hypothetical protein
VDGRYEEVGEGSRCRVSLTAEVTANVAAHQAEVFAYSGTVSADLAARVEAETTDQEVQAVTTSRPAPYVHDVVTSCRMRTRARPAAAPTGSRRRRLASHRRHAPEYQLLNRHRRLGTHQPARAVRDRDQRLPILPVHQCDRSTPASTTPAD